MFELKIVLLSLLCVPFLFVCAKLVSKLIDEAVKNKNKQIDFRKKNR